MVLVFYSVLDDKLTASRRDRWLAELPEEKRSVLRRIQQPETQQLSLLGYQLVKRACLTLGVEACRLDQLVFAPGQKPVFPHGVYFSLSHSQRLVACAVGRDAPLGLDTEYVRPIDGSRLRNTLSETERMAIENDPSQFFDVWTSKEAVIKAHGHAGIHQMKEVCLEPGPERNTARFDNRKWFLTRLQLQPGYVTHLATTQPAPKVRQHPVLSTELY